MSTPLYQVELLQFRDGRGYATVQLHKTDTGIDSEWWVSHNSSIDIQVCGYFRIPLFGADLDEGARRAKFIAKEVIEFASYASGGGAGVGGASDEDRRAHCRQHLLDQSEYLAAMTVTEKTATLYRLATQFNINNPAALIASVEGLSSVRTVHDRLAHARRLGLLDSPGKGNTKKKDSRQETDRHKEQEEYGDSPLERYAKRNPTIFD
jgi:hypothetical protein